MSKDPAETCGLWEVSSTTQGHFGKDWQYLLISFLNLPVNDHTSHPYGQIGMLLSTDYGDGRMFMDQLWTPFLVKLPSAKDTRIQPVAF